MEKLPPIFTSVRRLLCSCIFPLKKDGVQRNIQQRELICDIILLYLRRYHCSCICISSPWHVLGSLITYFHELKTQERGIKDETAECEETTNVRNLEESPIWASWESATLGSFTSLSAAGIKAGRNINALKLQRCMKTLMSILHCRCVSRASLSAVQGTSCNATNFKWPPISK